MFLGHVDVQSSGWISPHRFDPVLEREALQVRVGQLQETGALRRVADIGEYLADLRVDGCGLAVARRKCEQIDLLYGSTGVVLKNALLRRRVHDRSVSRHGGWLTNFLVVSEEEHSITNDRPAHPDAKLIQNYGIPRRLAGRG